MSKCFAMLKCTTMAKWQFSLTLANFLLANYRSLKLTRIKAIKAVEDHKYLIFAKNLLNAFFNLCCATQITKFLINNNTVSLIGYVICLANITNEAKKVLSSI